MTMPFLPNEDDATYTDQAEPDSVDFEILLAGAQDTGVVSGCAVTDSVTPAQTVDVAIGVVRVAGRTVAVAADTDVAVTAADVTNPRIDLITSNLSGVIVVTAGTPAAQPVLPAIPATSVPLATLYVPANDNVHGDAQINDKRVNVPEQAAFNVKAYGATGDGTTNDTTAIQAAITAAEVAGGEVTVPPLTYLYDGVTVTASVPLIITGYGATLKLSANGQTGITVSQDNDKTDGHYALVRGLRIDGDDKTTTIGVKIVDTTQCTFEDVSINKCTTGALFTTEGGAGQFVERCTLLRSYISYCGTGVSFTKNGGDASLDENRLQDVWISDCDLGVNVGAATTLYRGVWDNVSVWLNTAGTKGFFLDGSLLSLVGNISVESFSADTTIGVHFGSNVVHLDLNLNRWWMNIQTIGVYGSARILNDSGTALPYQWGPNFMTTDVGTAAALTVGKLNNPVPRIEIMGSGEIQWNDVSGGGTSNVTRIVQGSATPEGAVSAPIGSTFLRDDGALGTAAYYKASGSGNTGWRPIGTGSKEESGPVTLDWEDSVVNMESTGAIRAVTLPDNAAYAGKNYMVRRDGTNNVTVTRAGSDTFDDAATVKSLDTDGAAIGIFSIGDGEWKIVGTQGTVT